MKSQEEQFVKFGINGIVHICFYKYDKLRMDMPCKSDISNIF